MNEYTLSYTGAQVDEILTKAQTDVSAQEGQPLSPEAQQIVRNNINAATKDIEPTVAQLRSEVTSLNTDVANLNSNITEVNEHLESLDEVRDVTIPYINEVLETLEYTAEEYLFLASYLADDFSPAIIYDKGDFVRYSGNIYERKEDANSPGYWKANEWIYLGSDEKKPVHDLGLILRPFVTEVIEGNPCIINGVIFTVTQYNTIIINGTLPEEETMATYILLNDTALKLKENTSYTLTGALSSEDRVWLQVSIYDDNGITPFQYIDYGTGVTFNTTDFYNAGGKNPYPVVSLIVRHTTPSSETFEDLIIIPKFVKN